MKDDITLINEVLDRIPNKYMAVMVASKRAKEINNGRNALVKTGATKPTTIAMEEIAAGKVVPGPGKPEIKEVEEEEKEVLPSPDISVDEEH